MSAARAIVDAVLAAARPGPLVERALGELSDESGATTHVLAVGKAARSMSRAALGVVGPVREALVVTVPQGDGEAGPGRDAAISGRSSEGCGLHPRTIVADHPVPTPRNVEAAAEVVRFVESVPSDGRLLFLLSGGASALLCLPRPPLTLEQLAALTRDLLASGATIREINAVRKHAESAKGGSLARECSSPAKVLVLSDVLPDAGSNQAPLDAVGSGPMAPDPTTFADAARVVRERGISGRHPAVAALLARGEQGEEPETPGPGDLCFARVEHRVIGDNRLVVDAACSAAEGAGYRIVERRDGVEGEARDVARALVARGIAIAQEATGRAAIVWGGETTVTLGDSPGLGGRNQEMALAAAVAMETHALKSVPTLVTLATDGRDGPTDAAGALVDAETCKRIRKAGIDPHKALARHDAYRALGAADALLRPGPTGTNLNDVAVMLIGSEARDEPA